MMNVSRLEEYWSTAILKQRIDCYVTLVIYQLYYSVGAADLFQIYPTPPSHDNHNTALSPADHNHHPTHASENPDTVTDIPEPTAAIYRTSSVAKYLSVSDYQPLELPSKQQPLSLPTECQYQPWNNTSSTNSATSSANTQSNNGNTKTSQSVYL